MSIKFVVGVEVLNMICVYAPQVGRTDNIKMIFWEELDEVCRVRVYLKVRNFFWGYFNRYIGTKVDGYE